MTDRDTFAAAALTGLIANGDYSVESTPTLAYRMADAMLRERGNHSEEPNSSTNHDASPDAKASLPTADHAVCRGRESGCGTGKQPAPPCVETDGFSSGSSSDPINRNAERESPRRECGESSLRDVPQLDNSRAAGGPEHHISEAQIDALECVVEDGRIVGMSVYGHLRSLLVRLRPEWEQEDGESDRPQPINDDRLAALEKLSALDQELELKHGIKGNPMIKAQTNSESEVERLRGQLAWTERERDSLRVSIENLRDYVAELNAELFAASAAKTDTTQPRNGALSGCETVPDPDSRVWETPCTPPPHATPPQGSVHGEGSVPDSRTENEPVAWWLKGAEYDTGCEYEYVSLVKESAEAAAKEGGTVTPLYAHQQPTLTDEERGVYVAALRGLLERLGA